METYNLNWVIAHEPKYLFYRVAEDFARLVKEYAGDIDININILTDDEYNTKFNPEVPVNRHNLWKLLQSGDVHIAQMQTTSLARQFNPEMHVLDLPYIFRDHDHAANVLEGEVGVELLNKFDSESRIKGLAYTYSGGFRLLPSHKKVTSLGELAGAPIRSGLSRQAREAIEMLGGNPVPADTEEAWALAENGSVTASEYVTQRIYPDGMDKHTKSIIHTEHSLFLTSIVVNQDWFNNLPKHVQDVFMKAALEAARNERALSLLDGETNLKRLEDEGVNVVYLSKEEEAELQNRAADIRRKHGDMYFSPGLVEKIEKTH